MKLVLRLDVDKPYGNHTLVRKISSKLVEETLFNIKNRFYLDHVLWTIQLLQKLNIKCIFYFRNCTAPDLKVLNLLKQNGHSIGFHAENTSNEESFLEELTQFKLSVPNELIHSFSKHGSGVLKLGRYHYPPYEPDKYISWSKTHQIPFYFGNDSLDEKNYQPIGSHFFPACFWLENEYRKADFNHIDQLFSIRNSNLIPIISHPESLLRSQEAVDSLMKINELANRNNVSWIDPKEINNYL